VTVGKKRKLRKLGEDMEDQDEDGSESQSKRPKISE
jgi:hypothetical protein